MMDTRTSKIYHRMLQYFGPTASREYGELAEGTDFVTWCRTSSDEQVKKAFAICEDRLAAGNQFAPSIGMLSQTHKMLTDREFCYIMQVIRSGIPKHQDWRIDWIIRKHSKDIQLTHQDKLRKTVASLYARAVELGEDACRRRQTIALCDISDRDKRLAEKNVKLPENLQNIFDRIQNRRKCIYRI